MKLTFEEYFQLRSATRLPPVSTDHLQKWLREIDDACAAYRADAEAATSDALAALTAGQPMRAQTSLRRANEALLDERECAFRAEQSVRALFVRLLQLRMFHHPDNQFDPNRLLAVDHSPRTTLSEEWLIVWRSRGVGR